MTNDESNRKSQSSDDSGPESEGAGVRLKAAPSGSKEALAAESSAGVQGLNPDLLLEDPDTIKLRDQKITSMRRETGIAKSQFDNEIWVSWKAKDAVPFVLSYEGSLYSKRPANHGGMMNKLFGSTTRLQMNRAGLKLVGVQHLDRFKDIVWHGHGQTNDLTLEGRLWTNHKVISLWRSRRDVLRKWMPKVREFLSAFGLSPEHLRWEFIDYKDHLFDWGKITKAGKAERRSKADQELVRQMHLNPQAKRQVLPKVNPNAEVAQRAGFDTAASYNSTRVIGDSLLTDPDNWRIRRRLWGNEQGPLPHA